MFFAIYNKFGIAKLKLMPKIGDKIFQLIFILASDYRNCGILRGCHNLTVPKLLPSAIAVETHVTIP